MHAESEEESLGTMGAMLGEGGPAPQARETKHMLTVLDFVCLKKNGAGGYDGKDECE